METQSRFWLLAIAVVMALTACATPDRPIRSEAAAGIGDEPIRLDSPNGDPKYKDYLARRPMTHAPSASGR